MHLELFDLHNYLLGLFRGQFRDPFAWTLAGVKLDQCHHFGVVGRQFAGLTKTHKGKQVPVLAVRWAVLHVPHEQVCAHVNTENGVWRLSEVLAGVAQSEPDGLLDLVGSHKS